MWRIYVFHLRCYHQISRNTPIECYWAEGIDVEAPDYDDALRQARKEFIRQNPYCEGVDEEAIEVMDWELA